MNFNELGKIIGEGIIIQYRMMRRMAVVALVRYKDPKAGFRNFA
jgi:hypothetical protein